ncbi:BTAD domain-containing putative transcriptional regulator [Parafrankia sp. BMG5.11]|uniref:AfsR/SARP family transcriptional regulator n=1 Tax=Parafrankia sp. BMG5.11 TaxID=222540 RepID=UPI001039B9CD|nr:BTAD domain-containing putative transcriptional regulator [Parafrankia sp. BMG5.11]TCJ35314.1 hypothetical protein E0504_27690 [Parafrankia sp. BMG5.11]
MDDADTGVEIDVLGPMRLRVDGAEVDVPGARRRALLAMLAMSRARVVGAGTLIDAVWGADPPASADGTLHSHLSRVRGHLGPRAGRLIRDGAGYRLVLGADALDATRAEAFAAQARALRPTDPAAAVDRLRQALDLWRGDALAEFGSAGPLGAEAARLTRLRQTLVDGLLDARLACGPAGAVIGDAEQAATADPLRESALLLLVRALALDGRAPEALAAARDFRRRLADQTGLEASPALADLERAVARGDLAGPVPGAVQPGPPVTAGQPVTARPAVTAGQPVTARPAVTAVTTPARRPDDPDGRGAGPARARVPRSPTPLLGRAEELDRLAELLHPDRCVTVVGPGGVGKTRLMLDLVHHAAPRWPDGATLVELAPVRDEATVPFALAQALEVTTRGDLLRAVIDYLATRRQILVIDNCEHLLDAVRDLVGELLRWVPNLTVLATSRAPLGTSGEWVFRLGPLPLPAPDTDPAGAAAVRLFLDRARQARGGRDLPATALEDAAAICRRLDGLPLAIELAASRLTALSPADLRARMDAGLDLGRGRRPPVDDDRHHTLRGTIAWSYRLLDAQAQRLFRHLAAVPGLFDLSIAEAVADAVTCSEDPEPAEDPIAALSTLVDASMVETVTDPAHPDDGTAFRMLDSIRAFGLEAARAAGELETAQILIAAWAREFTRSAAGGLHGPDGPRWGRRILTALPVLRACRERMLKHGDLAGAARISIDLGEFAAWHNNAELWAWALETADDPGLAELPEAPLLYAAASHAAWRAGSLGKARELADRALATAVDDAGVATARYALGVTDLFAGEFASSIDHLVAAAALDADLAANEMAVAALAAAYGGDADRADALVTRARQLVGTSGGPIIWSFVEYVQAEIHIHDDPVTARRHAERALAAARAGGVTFAVGISLVTLASSAVRTGDLATATAHYPEVIRLWLRTGSWPQQWTTLRNVADLFGRLGRDAEALLLSTAADADPDSSAVVGADAERVHNLVEQLRDRLGVDAVAAIRRQAAQLTRLEVVDRALTTLAELEHQGAGTPAPPVVG